MGYSKLSVAADILAEQFGGDPAILEQLLGKSAASNLTTGQVLTIAAGWPECGYLQEAYELITTNKAYEDRPVTIFEVLYSKIPAPKFADQLVHTLNQMPSGNNYLSGALLRPVLRRVKNDLSVKQAIADRVVDSTDISGKPSLCRLLAAAGSLPQNVRAWMDGEVRRQLKGADPPEIGFDLFSSRDQSVVLSLLDAM